MAGQAIVTIGNNQWQVALASMAWELATGLGGLSYLEPSSGMLFDLGYNTAITVTTGPMLFPLDIAFISSSFIVVDVAHNVPPGYLVASRLPARYFLEVNAGELQGIDVGARVEIGFLAQQSQPDWLAGAVSLSVAMLVMSLAIRLIRSMLNAALAEPQVARLAQTYPYLTPGQEGPATRLAERWSRSAKRNSSLGLRELEELHRRYGYDVDDCRQALIEYRDIQREDYADAEEYQEARDEAWERFLECLEELAAEEEGLTSARPEPNKLPKPTREDVSVGAWQERDRLGIWISDNRTGRTIAEWWDDEAREMFEQGLFKPGVPQYSWEKPGPGFVASVLDYAESVGLLARGGASGAASYLPQVSPTTKLDGLQIVKAYKQISRQGVDEICVQLQAWAIFPQGKKPHFISLYRSGDCYIISPLYAHVEHSVEVPVDRVKAWIKSLPVRHFESMAVAPQCREEAERLAKEVDEPIDILPLPPAQINLRANTKLKGKAIPLKPGRTKSSDLEYLADSPELLTQTIAATGYRERIDCAFQEAIARAKGIKEG